MFYQSGNVYTVYNEPPSNPKLKTLPAGLYTLIEGRRGPLYEITELPPQPKNYYGKVVEYSDRVVNTYKTRGRNTGVLLSGRAGSGKTLQAWNICIRAIEAGIPVVSVPGAYPAEFLEEALKPFPEVVVLIDEFEKKYSGDLMPANNMEEAAKAAANKAQSGLLTLLDGTAATNVLFLLTSNSVDNVSPFLLNRPGRIYYHLTYDRLPAEVIQEFAKQELRDKAQLPGLVEEAVRCASNLTFDVLKALIEEMNRYDLPASKASAWLNILKEGAEWLEMGAYIDGRLMMTYEGTCIDFGSHGSYGIIRQHTSHVFHTTNLLESRFVEPVMKMLVGDGLLDPEKPFMARVCLSGNILKWVWQLAKAGRIQLSSAEMAVLEVRACSSSKKPQTEGGGDRAELDKFMSIPVDYVFDYKGDIPFQPRMFTGSQNELDDPAVYWIYYVPKEGIEWAFNENYTFSADLPRGYRVVANMKTNRGHFSLDF